MKRICCIWLMGIIIFFTSSVPLVLSAEKSETNDVELRSASYVLMEGSTGKVICKKDMDKRLMPASITKIMTLILIYDALEKGTVQMEEKVSVSAHAAGMGGSQVYLEEGESQTVGDLIKCIAIASANDASVAMAEHIEGSEEVFVKKMNQKAKKIGMKNTRFMNCCGLDDAVSETEHYSTAYDIALMSRELITKHPEIKKISTIWMDEITHSTRNGESIFGLTNTNKLVRTYQGITGLKTGSTSRAKFCLSATANRDGVDLIAVVMAAPEPKTRFEEAARLLDYGFANCKVYKDKNQKLIKDTIEVKKGVKDFAKIGVKGKFSYVCVEGENMDLITKKMIWNYPLEAPVEKGTVAGKIVYYYNKEKIGEREIFVSETVDRATYADCFVKIVESFFLIR